MSETDGQTLAERRIRDALRGYPHAQVDITTMLTAARAQALREYAAELDWKQPDTPCADAHLCCGSASSCDRMWPSIAVVGASSLRARADAIDPPATHDLPETSED